MRKANGRIFLLSVAIALPLCALLPAPAAVETGSPGAPLSEQEEQTELDLPVDATVRLSVDPLFPSSLVDRVMEPCTVTVRGSNITSVDIMAVPVDAPYGGFAVATPRLVGHAAANKRSTAFLLRWSAVEPDRYLKLFAVVHKKNGSLARSKTLDVCMSGPRYHP
jgi:hypothetical protein